MQKTKLFIISNPLMAHHLTGDGHPECPERLSTTLDFLSEKGWFEKASYFTSEKATRNDILSAHTLKYYLQVKDETGAATDLKSLTTGDVVLSSGTFDAALLAAGSAILGVDKAMEGVDGARSFCLVRPPGHHAESEKGMGFCLFNNAAIAARYAQKQYGIKRILIVDWDVHHGNGTQEIFYEDPSVFYFSTHQKGLYPGTGDEEETGRGKGVGTTLNCPIESGGHSRARVLDAFKLKLKPLMEQFSPELVIISAGFDSRLGDPLGGFNLTDQDFFDLTRTVIEIANQSASGRIVSILEGGYHIEGLHLAIDSHLKALEAS